MGYCIFSRLFGLLFYLPSCRRFRDPAQPEINVWIHHRMTSADVNYPAAAGYKASRGEFRPRRIHSKFEMSPAGDILDESQAVQAHGLRRGVSLVSQVVGSNGEEMIGK